MFLPTHQIFPFYELRSAAPEHINKSQHEVPMNERIMEMRRRISSQLDTLIIANQPNAILGAWGCGEFHNEPELVSDIYREEIERRSSFFKHLMFPILDMRSARNFEVFEKALKGIKLGDTRSLQNNNKV